MRLSNLSIAALGMVSVALLAEGCSQSTANTGAAGWDGDGAAGSGTMASSGAGSSKTSDAAASGASSGTGAGGGSTGSGAGSSAGSSAQGGSGQGGASGSSAGSSSSTGSSSSGATGSTSGSGALSDASTTDVSAPSGDGGSLDAIRQFCVDQINMYRATLNLSPLSRATTSEEACSDMGAQKDATSMMAHSSAGMCPGSQGQDTCPQLPVGGGSTLQSSLQQCLMQMWNEGPPPSGTTVQQCIQDYQGCFLQHGHWINMSMASYKGVSCGFYQYNGTTYWGNQDFY